MTATSSAAAVFPNLRPSGWSMNRTTMSTNGNDTGKLIPRWQITWNVFVVGGNGSEFFAGTFVWIEYDDRLSSVFLEIMKRCYKVGVSRDKYDAVKTRFHVIDEHLRGDVYVGPLLLCLPHGCDGDLLTGLAWFLCKGVTGAKALIITFNYAQFWTKCHQSGKIYGLPHLRGWLCRIIVDASSKVFDGHNFVFTWAWQK